MKSSEKSMNSSAKSMNSSAKIYEFIYFPFGEEKLIAPLIATPNVDRANQRQEKGNKLN